MNYLLSARKIGSASLISGVFGSSENERTFISQIDPLPHALSHSLTHMSESESSLPIKVRSFTDEPKTRKVSQLDTIISVRVRMYSRTLVGCWHPIIRS